jgi:hypothetical protein
MNYWSFTAVLLSFTVATILFPFPLTPAESIVIGLQNRVGAANT